MSRKERRASRAERIRVLIEAGDHAGARADAQAVLADAAAPEDDRKAAAEILSSLAPDSSEIVSAGPNPGNTPMAVPTVTPIEPNTRLTGLNAAPNPRIRFWGS
jgi:hypothetical protein